MEAVKNTIGRSSVGVTKKLNMLIIDLTTRFLYLSYLPRNVETYYSLFSCQVDDSMGRCASAIKTARHESNYGEFSVTISIFTLYNEKL